MGRWTHLCDVSRFVACQAEQRIGVNRTFTLNVAELSTAVASQVRGPSQQRCLASLTLGSARAPISLLRLSHALISVYP